eukprot:CAMPEP_0172821008 /NCGR_PEP_ID=MMETSP1075-20121228/15646_1 /TAXON_ID=2916 /ORGANISM="Ceratium fusus, Strain PA161109" /LENGTH=74 /DNA_ID=CAMNT_0013661761 /DNA_START=369 /DNA_END=593 /DNA_ORIENTATION=+
MRRRSPGIGPVQIACDLDEVLTGVVQEDGQRFAGHTRPLGVDMPDCGVLSLFVAIVNMRFWSLAGAPGHVVVRQ